MRPGHPVLVAGAGVAGLTAALAFARHGQTVVVLDKAQRLEEAGAGIQLPPNASRLLFALGLRDPLLAAAARPEAVRLIDARTLRTLAKVPLGAWGEARWGAPYLVLHRADLQRVLLDAVEGTPAVTLRLGAEITGASLDGGCAIETAAGAERGAFLVGADGVRSAVRAALQPGAGARATGLTAWRATVAAEEAAGHGLDRILPGGDVAAFLHAKVHLVAYPVRARGAVNLVAVAPTRGSPGGDEDGRAYAAAFGDAAPALAALAANRTLWTAWPILAVPGRHSFAIDGRAALIGDAAHAMPPFAAQGAAMAVEDAVTLAQAWSGSRLARWDAERRARIGRVGRRGSLNRLTWHARGPVRLVRDAVLGRRAPEALAADLDWLYGWRVPQP